MKYIFILLLLYLQIDRVKSQVICSCPPQHIILPDGQKGVYESQRATCHRNCTTTIHAENASEVILFTFTHIPESFEVEIYDGDTVNPKWALEDCDVENGKQCYSSSNEVTFIFIPNWKDQQATGPVELFLLSTSKEHAQTLVKTKTKSVVKRWEIWVIIAACLVGLILVGLLGLLIVHLYKRKRAKEQLKTMQSCMIYAVPNTSMKRIDAF